MYGTISQLLDKTTAENPDAIVQLGKNRAGSFIPRSYSLLQRESRGLALALKRLGVRRGDAVGIISDNRSEWFVADLAILSLGAADVPRGRDAMPYEIEYMFSVTGLSIAFAENDAQLEKIIALKPSLPALRTIILIEGENKIDSVDVEVRLYFDLLEEGLSLLDAEGGREEIEHEIALGNKEDTATIIFTSGTTGLPKGSLKRLLFPSGILQPRIGSADPESVLAVLGDVHPLGDLGLGVVRDYDVALPLPGGLVPALGADILLGYAAAALACFQHRSCHHSSPFSASSAIHSGLPSPDWRMVRPILLS